MPCRLSLRSAPISQPYLRFIPGSNRGPKDTEFVSDATSRLRTNAALTLKDHDAHETPDDETQDIVYGFHSIFLILDLATIASRCINLSLTYGLVS